MLQSVCRSVLSKLQCVAVCCSVLQYVAVSVLQCVAVCCSALQCVAVSVLQCAAVFELHTRVIYLHRMCACGAVCCGQHVAACCR